MYQMTISSHWDNRDFEIWESASDLDLHCLLITLFGDLLTKMGLFLVYTGNPVETYTNMRVSLVDPNQVLQKASELL